MVTMAFPYALDAIGWETYMINGAWDVVEVIFVMVWWVETKGKSLEEMDVIFQGRHNWTVPATQEVLEGVQPHLTLDGLDVVKVESTEPEATVTKAG